MTHFALPADWQSFLTDPYAILGIALSADEKQIAKQYRHVAKLLHPDRYVNADPAQQEFVNQLVARLINPAYASIKQSTNRAEVLAILRLHVQRMTRDGSLIPQTPAAQLLMQNPDTVDLVYEQQVATITQRHYHALDAFGQDIQQLRELNWVYLRLKLGYAHGSAAPNNNNHLLRPTAASSTAAAPPSPPATAPTKAEIEQQEAAVYSQRHYDRAHQYIEKGAYDKAIQEMRDAVKMQPNRSDHHALLSYAYFLKDLPGMATVHCRRALQLNSSDRIAKQVAQKLKLTLEDPTIAANTPEKRGLFSRFRRP
jgi:tetratricopeptide (TPR) repeat protein